MGASLEPGKDAPRGAKGWYPSSRAGGTLFGQSPPSQGTDVEAILEEDTGPAHGEAGNLGTGILLYFPCFVREQ